MQNVGLFLNERLQMLVQGLVILRTARECIVQD